MKFIRGNEGSHPNFLAYSLNLLMSEGELLEVLPNHTFDHIIYTDSVTEHWADGRGGADKTHSIRIIVDNEILWIHQLLCRATGYINYDIIDLENNLFDLYHQEKRLQNNVIIGIFGKDFAMAKKQYERGNKKQILEFMYKEKVFGKYLPNEYRMAVFDNPPKDIYLFPFSAFYTFDQFDSHIQNILPNRNKSICLKLHEQFLSNVKNTPKSIKKSGSILYKTWVDYTKDQIGLSEGTQLVLNKQV